ncbi:MAG: marine proteobacterial sortase target protein [Woeseiaceae bacterium]|nr:marine proteobacterial sortase target protein [Woeseiaceae bacterium]
MFKHQTVAARTLLLLASLMLGPAQANTTSPGEMQAGSLLMRMSEGYETATLLNTDVSINVNGLVARVSVMQEFRNEGSEWVEGIYVFPLPGGAAVDHMRLYVGERFIEGEIREKEQARKEYEQAKQEGKKTSLVEQQRANLFTTSVANIGPGESVIVEIEYLEDVRYEDGTFSLRFPMTLTPRYIPGEATSDRQGSGWSPDTTLVDDASLITPPMVGMSKSHKVSLQARINAGMPLEIIASRYHPVNVSESTGHYSVALANGQASMDHDFELLWRPVPSSAPRGMAFAETVNGEPYYLLLVMPPDTAESSAARMPREMIFIVDTSGSMHGVSIEQARKALSRAIDGLQPGDLFNVIEFNSYPNPLFANSVPAGAVNISTARNFVSRLQANGGTEMRSALQLALRNPPSESYLRQIIFITDGAVGNEEGLFKLIEAKLGNARLFTVGIGSAPNSWFMRKAAETGRGTFTTISALHEVGEKMDRLFRKLEHPQVTNIDLQWPGGTRVDGYPAIVPDLYLGEPVSVRIRASSAFRPSDTIRIVGDSVAGAWSADLSLDVDAQSPGIAALWARARIADLLDKERRGADVAETRSAIVETALKHHLVSKHTSLIAVDKTPVRPAGDLLLKEQVPNLMAHGQSSRAIFGFPATATDGPALRLKGLLTLLAAMLILAMSAWMRRVTHGFAN